MAAHEHQHEHGSELSEMQLRVRALETILTEKGYVDPAALDRIIETYETKVGPHNGARIVARAWSNPAFKRRCSTMHRRRMRGMGHESPVGSHLIAVENTPQAHHMVVCTLCSCYPWEVLGLAAGLVQIGAVPLARGDRPERRAGRVRRRAAAGDRDPHLGLDRRDAVPGLADAARRVPKAGARSSLPQLVTRDSMVGTGLPQDARRRSGR